MPVASFSTCDTVHANDSPPNGPGGVIFGANRVYKYFHTSSPCVAHRSKFEGHIRNIIAVCLLLFFCLQFLCLSSSDYCCTGEQEEHATLIRKEIDAGRERQGALEIRCEELRAAKKGLEDSLLSTQNACDTLESRLKVAEQSARAAEEVAEVAGRQGSSIESLEVERARLEDDGTFRRVVSSFPEAWSSFGSECSRFEQDWHAEQLQREKDAAREKEASLEMRCHELDLSRQRLEDTLASSESATEALASRLREAEQGKADADQAATFAKGAHCELEVERARLEDCEGVDGESVFLILSVLFEYDESCLPSTLVGRIDDEGTCVEGTLLIMVSSERSLVVTVLLLPPTKGLSEMVNSENLKRPFVRTARMH